ncbi:restriction endonuclease subunit S [Rhodobacter capsulatus]|uniref:Restriction endonuclease subunit S n=1 Tax=Rhodobacter capsulatus TaxID=1061 RepID=A0A4U1JMN3_RHOCA|nr:restriction endonuclease subunit S [Rhodobacter capsulatus]TKD15614.1 restriction endonuclease subunit S [Rhodobacter capsulatus]
MIETCSLGSVVDVSAGQPAPKPNEFGEDGLPFIRAGSLEKLLNGGSLADCERIPPSTAARKRFRVYPKDTIVFAKSGMSATLGRVYRLPEPAHVVSHLAALVPTGKCNPAFLTYWLRKNPPSHLIKDPAYPSIRVGDIGDVEIPSIPMEEQQRIAGILDKSEEIRRKRERLIYETQDFVRSAYLHTVGHLNPNHGDWEPLTIEALAEDRKGAIRSGPFGSALRHGEFVDEGIAVLGIDNAVQNKFTWAERRFITPFKYEELRRYKVFPGDVIITIMGTTGRSAVVPDDIPEAITTKHLATITCNKELIHPEVLSLAIHSDPLIIRQIKSFNKGAIMDGLNLGIIRKLEINLPPMEEQLRFVRMLHKARAIEARSQTPDGSGEDLFRSLSQRAFRGEL